MPIESGFTGQLRSLSGQIAQIGTGRLSRNGTAAIAAATPVQFLESNEKRLWATIVNAGANDVTIQLGEQGNATTGVLLKPGGSFDISEFSAWVGSVFAYSTGGTTLSYVEVSTQ